MSALGKHFQLTLLFVGKARSLPKSEVPGRSSLGYCLVLPTNIRVGRKGLPGTNTLAYLVQLTVTKEKKFYNIETRMGPSSVMRTSVLTYIPAYCQSTLFSEKDHLQ